MRSLGDCFAALAMTTGLAAEVIRGVQFKDGESIAPSTDSELNRAVI
jgi:hypothetical protein